MVWTAIRDSECGDLIASHHGHSVRVPPWTPISAK